MASFASIPVGSYYFDASDELCLKLSETHARDKFCTRDFYYRVDPQEEAHLAVPCEASNPGARALEF